MRTRISQHRATICTTLALAGSTLCVGGCVAERPVASVSDPSVFTTVHLAAASNMYARLSGDGKLDIIGDLHRNFRTTDVAYTNSKLRSDAMLDSSQRASAYAQAVLFRMKSELRVAASTTGSTPTTPTPASPVSDKPVDSASKLIPDADFTALAIDIGKSIQDSPFDRLDRIRDFYNGYIIKILQQFGKDSRVIDQSILFQAHNPYKSPLLNSLLGQKKAELDRKSKEKEEKTTEIKKLNASLSAMDLGNDVTENARTARHESFAKALEEKTKAIEDLSREVGVIDAEEKQIKQEMENVRKMTLQMVPVPVGALGGLVASVQGQSNFDWDQSIENVDRLLLIPIQVHIDPGNAANTMVGVRLRVVDVRFPEDKKLPKRWGGDGTDGKVVPGRDLVKVISLHPSRNYDLDDQAFMDKVEEAVESLLSGSVQAPKVAGQGQLSTLRMEERRERRRYMSRIAKEASFADAGSRSFGWNFFPSNLQLIKRPASHQFVDALNPFTAKSGGFEVKGFLDAGGRDCAVYVIVPKYLQSIEFEIESFHRTIDPYSTALVRQEVKDTPRRFTLHLPPWAPEEHWALFDLSQANAQPGTNSAPKGDTSQPNSASPAAQGKKTDEAGATNTSK